jgi:hypothetical protein
MHVCAALVLHGACACVALAPPCWPPRTAAACSSARSAVAAMRMPAAMPPLWTCPAEVCRLCACSTMALQCPTPEQLSGLASSAMAITPRAMVGRGARAAAWAEAMELMKLALRGAALGAAGAQEMLDLAEGESLRLLGEPVLVLYREVYRCVAGGEAA